MEFTNCLYVSFLLFYGFLLVYAYDLVTVKSLDYEEKFYSSISPYKSQGKNERKLKKQKHKVLVIPGDIIFGGLFPIHEQDANGCGGQVDPERGIHRLEALLFTLDKINKAHSSPDMTPLLPGIRVGAIVMDTCGSDYIALERALEIVQTAAVTDGATSERRDYSSCLREQKASAEHGSTIGLGLMPGLIGAASSTESIQVASLFRLFRIPMISYASTSAELSDKKRYEFFARTVPSDIFQSKAVIDILLNFDWTYVSVIYSDGDYGSSLFEAFLRRASNAGVCIAHVAKLSKRGEIAQFREHVRLLIENDKARVVVLFIAAKDVKQFLKAITLEVPQDKLPFFQFVASDGWGTQKALLDEPDLTLASEGAITLEIKTAPLPGFDQYFKQLMLDPGKNDRNPWFEEFCNLVPGDGCLDKGYQQDSKTIFVHNAVWAFALALRKIQRESCPMNHIGLCDGMIHNLQADLVYRTILNISFQDPINRTVSFDEFGDASGHYNIFKYHEIGTTGKYTYENVAEWNGQLKISRSMRKVVPFLNNTKVQSKCSLPCLIGQATRVTVKGCCWECINCSDHQITSFNGSQCVDCDDGYWPEPLQREQCQKLELKYLDPLSWYAVMSAFFAFSGMVVTLITIVVYIKFIDTPLVKASSVELSFFILGGCFVTFSTTFLYLTWPSLPICIFRRIFFGLGIAAIYSAIAVKINRIYRIFEAASKTSQQPPLISRESQLMLVSCFVGIQLCLSAVSLVFEPPSVDDFNPSGDRRNWYRVCMTSARSYSLLMLLTIILIVAATYYAIRTRNCPEPYREARVVGFSVYTTCIIWLAFLPLFFTTSSSVELQTAVICISLSMCGWVVLVCLFARRVYFILFRPQKNVKPSKFTLSAAVNKNAHIVTKLAISRQQAEMQRLHQSQCSTSGFMQSDIKLEETTNIVNATFETSVTTTSDERINNNVSRAAKSLVATLKQFSNDPKDGQVQHTIVQEEQDDEQIEDDSALEDTFIVANPYAKDIDSPSVISLASHDVVSVRNNSRKGERRQSHQSDLTMARSETQPSIASSRCRQDCRCGECFCDKTVIDAGSIFEDSQEDITSILDRHEQRLRNGHVIAICNDNIIDI